MKRVAIVAAHFPPSNLASVHRARLWAQYLPEFGWEPVIVTTHWGFYEEKLDWDLAALVAPGLEIMRTKALPTKPVRLIGDIGVRGLWWHYRAIRSLARESRVDFLQITIPSCYSALLGRFVQRNLGIPYGIDYIDPWVHSWPGTEKVLSKAWFSCKLASLLEPWAVRDASLITGVAPLYFEEMLVRNPRVRGRAITAAMPYGISVLDFEMVRKKKMPTLLFSKDDGHFNIVYAGALLPKAHVVLERLLEGLAALLERRADLRNTLRLHFVGTGKSPDDTGGYNVLPRAERLGVAGCVTEHPHRLAYADVLNHLINASAVLIVGSTEKHYTPSKVFQAILSGRPVFALLHQLSTAVEIIERSGAGMVLTLEEHILPSIASIAEALERFVDGSHAAPRHIDANLLEEFSARTSARMLAEAMNQALTRVERVHVCESS